ncbi:hypothetical protein N7468_000518 [Penicillium chermesinum]|uniref:Uncharacterized protein n=1 Tax=Penicillium chermesinum TaxID=63820 RepID=A0A9W9TYH3_9EURO|nr:uncharacterized protein N7468_000518 [Penicillium chermesinum]KAJ5249067.1 hypothetical protein N7468_000518 [Penicillium chermesinum]
MIGFEDKIRSASQDDLQWNECFGEPGDLVLPLTRGISGTVMAMVDGKEEKKNSHLLVNPTKRQLPVMGRHSQ